jgi:hypothetical protein
MGERAVRQGYVRFVRRAIVLSMWRPVGTATGGEVVGDI